jgi:flagellar motor switch protein FliM
MRICKDQSENEATNTTRKLTSLDCKKLKRFFRKILPVLRESWKQVINFHPKVESINNPQYFTNIVPWNEPCIEILFEYHIGKDEGTFSFCIPYTTIKPIMNNLYSKDDKNLVNSIEIKGDVMKPSTINDALDSSNLPVRAELGRSALSVKEIRNLHPGSIIELNNSAAEDIDVYVQDNKIAKAEVIVTYFNNFAVRITEVIGENGE